MKLNKTLALMGLIIATTNLYAIPVADGFDYPVGNRGYLNGKKVPIDEQIYNWGDANYNVKNNEEYNLNKNVYDTNQRRSVYANKNKWWNAQDVGSFYRTMAGVHSGEDWNLGSGNYDAGQSIYAVAHGKVIKIGSVYKKGSHLGGQYVVVEHRLPNNSSMYSVYVHVGKIGYNVGDTVRKGDKIAELINPTRLSAHLHFEMRTRFNKYAGVWPKSNGKGYYTHDGEQHTWMSKKQILDTFKIMREVGFVDPSDFIDKHRTLGGNNIYNDNYLKTKPRYDGTGSLINSSKNKRNGCQDGCSADLAVMHPHRDAPSMVTFQARTEAKCKSVSFFPDDGQPLKVRILGKSWGDDKPRAHVLTTIDSNGYTMNAQGRAWTTYAVISAQALNQSKYIKAVCRSYKVDTNYIRKNSKILPNEVLKHDLNYVWSGNASIITQAEDSNHKTFGVNYDLANSNKNYKSMMMFQWLPSTKCQTLKIHDRTSVKPTIAKISTKNWDAKNWNNTSCNRLPCYIRAQYPWHMVKVNTTRPNDRFGTKGRRIYAECQ